VEHGYTPTVTRKLSVSLLPAFFGTASSGVYKPGPLSLLGPSSLTFHKAYPAPFGITSHVSTTPSSLCGQQVSIAGYFPAYGLQ
jgi:hypothetical protein